MVQITPDDLTKIREKFKDKKIVFCSGVFDITHAGHIIFLEDCKETGDILVVAIGDDESIRQYKGSKRPILNETIRLKTVDSLKPVDYTFLIKSKSEPLDILPFIFEKLKPDNYIINTDAFDIPYRKKLCEQFSINLIILDRHCPEEFENISTSKIIEKIKNN